MSAMATLNSHNGVIEAPINKLEELKNQMTGVYSVKAKIISRKSTESIKVWTGRRGAVHQSAPKHTDVLKERNSGMRLRTHYKRRRRHSTSGA